MQPSERPNGPMGSPAVPNGPETPPPAQVSGAPAPQVMTGKQRNRRLRLWLALALGVLGLLCLGGVGVAVSLYDGATKIQRAAPDAVVDSFLRAYLVDRDDTQAALYKCKTGGDFSQIEAFRNDLTSREKQFSIKITVTWEGLKVNTSGSNGTVDVDLTRAISDGSEQVSKPWRFIVVDQDGWRVCGGAQQGT